jgi:hypothetical protein
LVRNVSKPVVTETTTRRITTTTTTSIFQSLNPIYYWPICNNDLKVDPEVTIGNFTLSPNINRTFSNYTFVQNRRNDENSALRILNGSVISPIGFFLNPEFTITANIKVFSFQFNAIFLRVQRLVDDLTIGLSLRDNRRISIATTRRFLTNGSYVILNGTTTQSLNTWFHLALTYDAVTLRLYINGILQVSTIDITWSNESEFIILGNAANTGFVDAAFDELTIYDYALSQDQIAADRTIIKNCTTGI